MFSLISIYTCNRIFKRWFRGIIDNFIGRFIIAFDTFHKGFFIVFNLDSTERHCVVRCSVRFKKWVCAFTFLYFYFIHTNRSSLNKCKVSKNLNHNL